MVGPGVQSLLQQVGEAGVLKGGAGVLEGKADVLKGEAAELFLAA